MLRISEALPSHSLRVQTGSRHVRSPSLSKRNKTSVTTPSTESGEARTPQREEEGTSESATVLGGILKSLAFKSITAFAKNSGKPSNHAKPGLLTRQV